MVYKCTNIDTSHGYHLISVWAMSQNPSLKKSMKKNSPKSTNSYVEVKSLILKPPGVVLFIFMGQFSPMNFEAPTHHRPRASCRSEDAKSKEDVFFFLKSKGQGFFKYIHKELG